MIIYEVPFWKYGIISAAWDNASVLSSAHARHAISNDQNSFTAASGVTSSTRFTTKMDVPTSSPEDTAYIRWGASSAGITHLKLFTENSEAPGEGEVSYTGAIGNGRWVSSGIVGAFDEPGWTLVSFDAVSATQDLFKLGFLGTGTFYLNTFLPLKEVVMDGPIYATQQDYWVDGLDSERTLPGELKVTSKGLTIKSRFTIVYETASATERDKILQLYQDTKGGIFPFVIRIVDLVYVVRFIQPPVVSEEFAQLFNFSIEVEEI